MRVRCISTQLTNDQKHQLRLIGPSSIYQIVPGQTYLVLGITFMFPIEPYGGGVHYEILNDNGQTRGIPSCLFEIQDPRCSKYWIAREHEGGSLHLWPEEFYAEFFHDDLSEGLFAAVTAFDLVVNRMKLEFPEQE